MPRVVPVRTFIGGLACAAVGLASLQAFAFGTIKHFFGQNAEHERITRFALAQAGLEPATLDLLAGASGSFGAVGAPDNPKRGLMSQSEAHCDNADHLNAPGYPQSANQGQQMLEQCRTWMSTHLDRAVTAAGALVRPDLTVDRPQASLVNCSLDDGPATAKCAALASLGLSLHAAQDFYSHSNWVDQTTGAIGPANPPGLGQTGRSPWLDLRGAAPFPAGLITGCYEGFPDGSPNCRYRLNGQFLDRVRHAVLNKDTGPINPVTGVVGAGTTPRGMRNHNFERAVAAAVDDTRDKWSFFRERILTRYGKPRGLKILCVITKDDPAACG